MIIVGCNFGDVPLDLETILEAWCSPGLVGELTDAIRHVMRFLEGCKSSV